MSDSAPNPMDIDYVSNLARIELTKEEREKFHHQLGDVLQYFEKLNEVDVEGVEPTAHAFPRFNVWDEDQAKEPFSVKQAIQNAPQSRNSQIVVPKVVED
jgi:aspartyl-tRNA(Asn)/glutamyl-tRNA(Gln) amidotransferase subunit C